MGPHHQASSKESKRGLGKSSLLFALGTFLSRLTGVLRESVLAGAFGANFLLDAFIVANRIPNLLRELLAEGALGASFTKVYATLKEEDETRARIFLHQSFQFFSIVVGVFCVLGMIFSPEIVELMTLFANETERPPQFFHDTVGLTRVLFPFIAFMTVGAIASGALHQKGRFFLSAISSVALNLGYILGAIVLSRLVVNYGPLWIETHLAERSIVGLALGVLVGGLSQTLIQVWGIRKQLLKSRTQGFPWSKDLRKVCKLMGPMVVAGSAGQVNVLVNTNFATALQEGSVTWLNFSFRVLQLPIGVFAVGLGIISLPALSRVIARKGSSSEVASKLQAALEMVTWLVVPCMCFLWINSLPVTQLLYQHGKFSLQDAMATADALYFYSFSLIAYGLLKVLTSYYYATERTNYAMKVSLFSILVNFVANLCFVSYLGHKGLALTTSCTLTLNALFLLLGLRRDRLEWQKRNLLISMGLLGIGFFGAWGAQYLITPFLASLPFLIGLALKWQTLFVITVNGTIVVSLFGLTWFFRHRFFRTSQIERPPG